MSSPGGSPDGRADGGPGEARPVRLPTDRYYSVAERLAQVGGPVRARLRARFDAAGLPYPPDKVVLLAIKDRRRLHVYASDRGGPMKLVHTHTIVAASGRAGPKLRESDRQVPEGIYAIEALNPNSRFHLSLRVNYPNEFDRRKATQDGRSNLGGNIMIHGSGASAGCLAMGDVASEDLFMLAADTGVRNVKVLIAPVDLRTAGRPAVRDGPFWLGELYDALANELRALPPAP